MIIINFLDDLIIIDPFLEHSQDAYIYVCLCLEKWNTHRGKFCDEEMTMCDGTNEFWCEHGGKCEEIVQGEIYDCKCPAGYAGEHCEHSGTPCGQIFCFHEAQCLALSQVHNACDCPPDWKGSADCSLPTLSQTGHSFCLCYIINTSILSSTISF